MDSHKNARLTPKGREEMMRAVVNGVQSYAAAARKFNTTPKTSPNGSNAAAQKAWMGCVITLKISSSDSQTSQVTCDAIEVLGRQRYTGKHIAAEVSVSPQLSAASSNGVDSISSAPWRQPNFRAACFRLGLRQVFIRPYTPKTNGKAERFIQAALRE